MSLPDPVPKLTRTLPDVRAKERAPSPHNELVVAPPPSPDHSNIPSSPEAEGGHSHETLRHSKARPYPTKPGPKSIPDAQGSVMDNRRGPFLLAQLNPAFVLQNSGSVARDHLASERTFLAYVRTSLTIATTGVALVQLFTVASNENSTHVSPTVKRIQHFARPLGATMVAFGLAVLLLGVYRYFIIQTSLSKGVFPITRIGVAGITVILAIVVIVVFGVLVSGRS